MLVRQSPRRTSFSLTYPKGAATVIANEYINSYLNALYKKLNGLINRVNTERIKNIDGTLRRPKSSGPS